MNCPKCNYSSKVVEIRFKKTIYSKIRTRECKKCKNRFHTKEELFTDTGKLKSRACSQKIKTPINKVKVYCPTIDQLGKSNVLQRR
jgi:transcriptional regulator NrdR family protein